MSYSLILCTQGLLLLGLSFTLLLPYSYSLGVSYASFPCFPQQYLVAEDARIAALLWWKLKEISQSLESDNELWRNKADCKVFSCFNSWKGSFDLVYSSSDGLIWRKGNLLSLHHFFITIRWCSSQSCLSSWIKLGRERASEDSKNDFWMLDGSEGKTES